MTTLAAARTALVSAVSASEAPIDPPACYVFSEGTDFTQLGSSTYEWKWRVTCAGPMPGNDSTNSALLATFVAAKLAILSPLAGWRLQSVSPDQIRQIAGGDQLTADIIVSTPVTI